MANSLTKQLNVFLSDHIGDEQHHRPHPERPRRPGHRDPPRSAAGPLEQQRPGAQQEEMETTAGTCAAQHALFYSTHLPCVVLVVIIVLTHCIFCFRLSCSSAWWDQKVQPRRWEARASEFQRRFSQDTSCRCNSSFLTAVHVLDERK